MEQFNSFLNINSALVVGKIFFLVCCLFFIIFLLIVLKQVTSMNSLIKDENDSPILKLTAFGLLIFAVSLFLAALVIL